MIAVRVLWVVLALAWLWGEYRLAKSGRDRHDAIIDIEQGSRRRLWLGSLTGIGLALLFKHWMWLPIPIDYLPRQAMALTVFALGLHLRYRAVRHLGQWFTTHITIHQGHDLIADGPYRHLRHPAYSGLLIALAGAGLAMGDGLAWACVVAPCFYALNHRIDLEERMLARTFGDEFTEYTRTRRKLIPWLY